MVLPRRPHLDARTMEFVRAEMLRSFADDAPLIEVSESEFVSVVMDMQLQVRAISLHGAQIRPAEAARLEQALISAINQAMAEVARRSAERLALALDQAASYIGPEV